jgi:hypothetical protein
MRARDIADSGVKLRDNATTHIGATIIRTTYFVSAPCDDDTYDGDQC